MPAACFDHPWAVRMVNTQPEQAPQISIIIRSKDEARFIGQALIAVFQQEIDLPFEVIVVDSGSTDGTLDIVQRLGTRLYEIASHQFTYGRALNYGASLARGQYLVNLSAHCIPTDASWMAKLVSSLRSNAKIAATYGGQIPLKGVNPFEEHSLLGAFVPDENGRIGPPFSNANCAIRKEIWKHYPFDEKASFGEDFIWSRMLPRAHEIKYVPDATVYHTHPLRLKYWTKRSYDNGLFVQYLKHVYGLQYCWGTSNNASVPALSTAMHVLSLLGRRTWRCLKMLGFLIQNGYLKFIPVFPIYVVLEQYYYRRGMVDGLRLYGSSKR
jgi:glycosyltransferase involved in cell wall biosynthesis